MEQTLLVLKGLPASGKSTYAKELVEQGWKRVNKDDLRAMIDNSEWSKASEKSIVELEQIIAKNYLSKGYHVVVDDTNFNWVDEWNKIANEMNVRFEVKTFHVPIYELLERDLKRPNSVGGSVILKMYETHLKPQFYAFKEGVENAYIFDIDGTLAKMDGRSPYDFTKVLTDKPNRDVVNLCKTLSKSAKIIIVSGREDSCKFETHKWLYDNGIDYSELHMRKTGDSRKDSIVKMEIFDEHLSKYNILGVFDDRNSCIDLWRSLGLTAFQVDYGSF